MPITSDELYYIQTTDASMVISILQNLAIRKRIWLLVLCSTLGLAGIASLDLLEARQQFNSLKLEQYQKQ